MPYLSYKWKNILEYFILLPLLSSEIIFSLLMTSKKYQVCLAMIKVFNNTHKRKAASISLQIQINHKGSWQYKFVTNWAIQEDILMNAMKQGSFV